MTTNNVIQLQDRRAHVVPTKAVMPRHFEDGNHQITACQYLFFFIVTVTCKHSQASTRDGAFCEIYAALFVLFLLSIVITKNDRKEEAGTCEQKQALVPSFHVDE